jgi:hypothetical protein
MASNERTHYFIHIPKNGGMSLRKNTYLSSRIQFSSASFHKSPEYTQELAETMSLTNDHHGNEHARLVDILPSARSSYKLFAFIRNPWSRVVSRYMFARKVIYIEKKQPESYCKCKTFEDFLEERHVWGGKSFMWHRAIRGWYSQVDYVTDEAGKLSCDLLRFERYNDDLQRYFGTKLKIRPRNVTGLIDDYKTVYTPKTIQIVADWYAKDIHTFGYDFNTGPKQNHYF